MVPLETVAGTMAGGAVRILGALALAFALGRLWMTRRGRSWSDALGIAGGVALGIAMIWLGGALGSAVSAALGGAP